MFQTLVANIMLKRPNDQAIKLYKVCSLKHDRREESVSHCRIYCQSQCESVSPLRSGEFQVSQAEIWQCGGGRQSNRPHVFFLGVMGEGGRGAVVLCRAVITNLAARLAGL